MTAATILSILLRLAPTADQELLEQSAFAIQDVARNETEQAVLIADAEFVQRPTDPWGVGSWCHGVKRGTPGQRLHAGARCALRVWRK